VTNEVATVVILMPYEIPIHGVLSPKLDGCTFPKMATQGDSSFLNAFVDIISACTAVANVDIMFDCF